MLTLRLLLCATLLTGCDIVFSVDEVASPTGHPIQVTGSLRRHVMENDASDVPRVVDLPPTMTVAEVAFADGATQTVSLGANGELSFMWPDDSEPYALTFRTPFSETTYQLTAKNPRLVERVGGRDDRLPVSPNTLVHVTLPTSPPPTDPSTYIELVSSGIWTRKSLSPATLTNAFDWGAVAPLSGPIGLLEAGPDAMYYAEYHKPTGIYELTRFGAEHSPAFADGQNNPLPFDLVTLAFDQCANITIDHEAERARLLSIDPDATGSGIGGDVIAAPAGEFLPEVCFLLTLRDLSGVPSPYAETVQYANPFEGLAPYAVLEVGTIGPSPVHSTVTVPLDSTCTPVVVPSSAVKIATKFTVSGTAVMTTGQTVAIDRSKPVSIDFELTPTGNADFFLTIVSDANASRVTRARIVSTVPHVTVDPDLLLPAHSYIVTVLVRVGVPNAAFGDFETNGSMFASGNASTTFQVQ